MPKAHTEQRLLTNRLLDQRHSDARLLGTSGARRDHHMADFHGHSRFDRDFVVAHHLDLGTENHQRLSEVKREGVIIIEKQYPGH